MKERSNFVYALTSEGLPISKRLMNSSFEIFKQDTIYIQEILLFSRVLADIRKIYKISYYSIFAMFAIYHGCYSIKSMSILMNRNEDELAKHITGNLVLRGFVNENYIASLKGKRLFLHFKKYEETRASLGLEKYMKDFETAAKKSRKKGVE